MLNGYNAFNASEGDSKGGGQTVTQVVLTLDGTPVIGESGAGHAEMKALSTLLDDGFTLQNIADAKVKTVACTAKPVCFRCATVLGLLGFSPATADTKKSRSGMGSTQWEMPQTLRNAIHQQYGDITSLLISQGNFDKM